MFECLYVFGSAVGTFFVFSGFLLRFLPCLLPRLLPCLLLYFQIALNSARAFHPSWTTRVAITRLQTPITKVLVVLSSSPVCLSWPKAVDVLLTK